MSEEKPKVLVYNEQLKLRGTFINNVAVVCITVGVFGPGVGFIVGTLKELPLGSMFAWTVGAVMLHFFAQSELSDLKEP